MRLRPIQVASLTEIMSGSGASDVGPEIASFHEIVGSGSYSRRAPLEIRDEQLEDAYKPLLQSYFGKLKQDHPGICHLVLKDAVVVGQGSVITSQGRLLRESAVEFLAHNLVPEGMTAHDRQGLGIDESDVKYVERPSLLLERPWAANYGHWLVDSAALAATLVKAGLPAGWQVVVALQQSQSMRAIVRETLETLLPDVNVVARPKDQIWHFRELHYISPVHVPPLFKLPESITALKSMIVRPELHRGVGRARFYVRRVGSQSRVLLNETDVLALCDRYGLSTIDTEGMTLHQQATLFHNAELIVGVKGAALTNALFAPASCNLLVLSPGDFPDPFFWDLVAQGGVGYSELFGQVASRDMPQGHNPFRVDVSLLDSMLASILKPH